jgi:hypothetical protein
MTASAPSAKIPIATEELGYFIKLSAQIYILQIVLPGIMFITAHIIAGLIVGKLLGSHVYALIFALAPDIDHIFIYVWHNVLFSPSRLWKTVTSKKDKYGNQRNILHSFFTWLAVSAAALGMDFTVGLVIAAAYLSHLLLDMLDGSDFYPLYPLRYKVIPYFSMKEWIFTGVLFAVFLSLYLN